MQRLNNLDYTIKGKNYIAIQGEYGEGCSRCAIKQSNSCLGATCKLPEWAYYSLGERTDMILPTDSTQRKRIPITTGVLDYFPLAIAAVAEASYAGNQQHHPDESLHWDKTKSTDHSDCIARHLVDRGKFDTDGVRHSAKLAWRALALLQLELENEKENYE